MNFHQRALQLTGRLGAVYEIQPLVDAFHQVRAETLDEMAKRVGRTDGPLSELSAEDRRRVAAWVRGMKKREAGE